MTVLKISKQIQLVTLLSLMLFFVGGPLYASDSELIIKFQDSERYSLHKEGNKWLRLDKSTGLTAICRQDDSVLVCRPSADAAKAYEDEILRLQNENTMLRNRLERVRRAVRVPQTQKSLLPQEKLDRFSSDEAGETAIQDQEFERALDFTEKAFRRFYDTLKDLDELEK